MGEVEGGGAAVVGSFWTIVNRWNLNSLDLRSHIQVQCRLLAISSLR